MAENILDVRLKQRYDTEANWTSINPVLLAGELAISSDKDGKYKVGNGSSKWSELSYAYQSGLDAKQNTITGGATTITSSNLTANRALISNGSGKVAVSEVTSTELGYLDGVTSNVQTQLDNKLSNCLVQTASGTAIVAQDSSDDPVRGLRVFGRTIQDGTPTPDAPVPLVSVGDDDNVEVGVYGANLFVGDYSYGYITNIDGTIEPATSGVICLKCFIPTQERVTIYIPNYHADNQHNFGYRVGIYKEDKTWIQNFMITSQRYVLKVPSEAKYMRFSSSDIYRMQAYYGDVTEYEEKSNYQSLTIQTPNGLPGIPVNDESIANYTDADGQMWCSDEVDLERGVYVQRVCNTTYDGSDDEAIVQESCDVGYRFYVVLPYAVIKSDLDVGCKSMNSNFPLTISGGTWDKENVYSINYNNGICRCYVSLNGNESLEEFKMYLAEKPMTVLAILATPIETPLTESELVVYQSLRSNYPVTTVLNDANAHMEFSYNTTDCALIHNAMSDITDEHIVSITADGKDLTYTKDNGTTTTVDTQQNFITLTKAEYDALVSAGTVDEDCYYFITDDANTSPMLIQYITFAASGWTASSDGTYWTQNVTASQITADDEPMVIKSLAYSTGATEAKAYNKAFGILCSGVGETSDGTVTWKCYKKPATDITVGLIKVMA